MASHRIVGREDVFPDGTVLNAYPVETWREGSAPSGTVAATATMDDGEADFHGLDEHRRYVAYAQVSGQHRGITFRTQPFYEQVFADRGRIESLEELMRDRTLVSVEECGARSGEADSTYAFTMASWIAYRAGGGTVTVGDGTFKVQGVPWFEGTFWQGNGPGSSILQPVDSDSTVPMFQAQATAEVRSTERFTQGGFLNLEFDGLDQDGACVAVSTYDLQEVAATDAASGLYVWLQQIYFVDNYIHDCAIGMDLWGDCRYVPIYGNRIWNCAVGTFIQGNHPNMRFNEWRFCGTCVDTTQMLDAEVIGCKFNLSEYGLGGPPDRVDRFGAEMGRVARTRIVGCHFFQDSVLALRLDIQNEVEGCLFYGHSTTGSFVEVNGGSNRLLGNWFFQMAEAAAIRIANASDGLTETIHIAIEHNRFSIAGGRAIEKVSGTNDIQGFRMHGNNFSISAAPADGLGGVVCLIPVGLGNFEHWSITDNYLWTSVVQPSYMVQVLAASSKGYIHSLNQYVSTQSVGSSKGLKVTDSTKAIVKDNRFVGGASLITGFGTVAADWMDLGTTTGAVIKDNPGYTGNQPASSSGTMIPIPGQTTATNLPLASGELLTSAGRRAYVDLSTCKEGRMTLRVNTGGSTGSVVGPVEYSLDNGGSWATLLTGTLSVDVGPTSLKTAWEAIPDAAKTDVLIRMMAGGGDGVADPVFALYVNVR